MKIKDLQNRWDTSLTSTVNERIIGSKGDKFKWKTFPTSPFKNTEENLNDFRGYPVPHNVFMATCENSDLSYITNTILFARSIFKNVTFHKVKDFHRLDGKFESCDFTGSKGEGMIFNGEFKNCNFSKMNLKRAMIGGNFENCIFKETNFLNIDWGGVYFSNCIFEGCKGKHVNYETDEEFDFNEEKTEEIEFSITVTGKVKLNEKINFYSENIP